MLCQFSVKNYKSFRDEMILDMQAASISEHLEQLIHQEDGQEFLPVSVIYGPNGGGKSNVLEAIFAMAAKVLLPVYAARQNDPRILRLTITKIRPFLFSEKTKKSETEFTVFFRTKKAEYRYILHVLNDNITYEKCDRIKKETNRKSALFERTANQCSLKGEIAHLRISDGVSDQLPLLSYLAITYNSNEIIKDIIGWFDEGLGFLDYADPLIESHINVIMQDKLKILFLKMLREMDIHIEDFRVVEENDTIKELYTIHKNDKYNEELTLSEESEGTRKIFHILPYIISGLEYGRTLLVDELDAKLHPVLIKYIIQLFTNPDINKQGAQLIFTSHDLTTMNSELFRRDEIWFVAKGIDENSKLYSLVEFKDEEGSSVRKDAKFDKQYLEGRYGADPYLQKIIDWSVEHA